MQRILSILSYVGIALVFGALAIRVLRPEWDQYAVYASWAGLALVLLYTVGQWREIVAFFRGRNARYGAIASVSVLVVLGILIAVNYLSAQQNKRWDLTENRQYSLSEQTINLLQGLEAPVKFLVFDQAEQLDRFRPRLDEFGYQSSQVQVEYIDADRRPVQAKEYEIQQYGTVVVEYMGRRERVTSDAEQDLTNALIKVLNPQEKRVYFLAGHGEKDPVNTDERQGYSGIIAALGRDNYQWEKLIIAQTNAIPENATVLVIAGPRTDYLEGEIERLREYLSKRNGKLLVMLDPPDSFDTPMPFPRLSALLQEWGIDATSSVVVDVSGLTRVATMPVAAPPYPNHVITDRFELITMFPLARAIVPAAGAPADRTAQPFVQTAAQTWAETNLATLEAENTSALAPEPEKGDTTGPVTIAAAVAVPGTAEADAAAEKEGDDADGGERRSPETRLAVFGDSDFVANAYLGIDGNGDLFMNTVNWLAQQESLIAIRPREAADRRLTMTANHVTGVFWLSLVLVPAAVLGAGVYTWWRRRER
jgi:ABC-type uncharacterized transport system involved in gliding motility auxiliary subunit